MSDKIDQCGNCRFWARRTDHTRDVGGGYCLRFPPVFLNEPSGGFLNDGWPMTHQQSWCGEYQRGRHRWNPEQP
jgi:hypothetical protein